MFGLRASLIAVVAAPAILLGSPRPGAAAGPPEPPPKPPNCSAVEQRVEETKQLLQSCENDRQSIASDRDSCVEQADATNQKLSASQAHAEACTESKANLCSEAATFAAKQLNSTGPNSRPMTTAHARSCL